MSHLAPVVDNEERAQKTIHLVTLRMLAIVTASKAVVVARTIQKNEQCVSYSL